MWRGLALSSVGIFFVVGCTTTVDAPGGGDTFGPTMAGPAEASYCALPGTTYSSSVTITGTAQYVRREHFGSVAGVAGSAGLGSADVLDGTHPAHAYPIRFAEIRVLGSNGAVAQCAETKVDGKFTFTLPTGGGSYTININSRALNLNLHASVLDQPSSNKFYSLTGTVVVASVSIDVGILTAPANGTLLGGAFNILDQLLNANLFLVNKVGTNATCGTKFTGCVNYDPTLHKISAYWMKGFNPNDYFGPSGGGLSFYLPGYSRLFILGGLNGDTDHSDTDHFDNSVIIHEYGHFLEDNWLKTDSPGGAHDGNELLDPRLAWSEGWGDFFQAAVRDFTNNPNDAPAATYIDTIGNTDGGVSATSMAFYIDTEISPSSSGVDDYPDNAGEGNFREFAITRLLWDAIDSTVDSISFPEGTFTDNVVSNAFSEIWASLSKPTGGFRDPAFAFRNVGSLHLAQQGLASEGALNWASIRGLNRHDGNTSHYAQLVSGSCVGSPPFHSNTYWFSLTPTYYSTDTGTYSTSNLFTNNRFFHLHLAAGGTHTLQLVYQDDDGTGRVADLDLYLYNSEARFAVLSDIVTFSQVLPTQTPATTIQNESVSASLGAGNYLINVNVYADGVLAHLGSTVDYNLLLDGVVLCPGNLVQ